MKKQILREYLEELLGQKSRPEDSSEQYVIKALGQDECLANSAYGLAARCMARSMSMSRIDGLDNDFVIRPLKEGQDLDTPINISASVQSFYTSRGYNLNEKERRHGFKEVLHFTKKNKTGFVSLTVDPVGGIYEPGAPWELYVNIFKL